MTLGGWRCSRNSLIALNVFYITVGILLISLGAHWMTSNQVSSLPIIGGVVACGVFLLIVSFGGIYATIKHHQVLLFFYMVILFCIFIVQFSVACALLAVSKETQHGIAERGWRTLDFETKDSVQKFYQCCAFKEDRSDLGMLMLRNGTLKIDSLSHPDCSDIVECGCQREVACCPTKDNCSCSACISEIEPQIAEAFRVTGGVSLFFSFTQFIGIWLTVRYRNQRNPYIGGSSSAFL